MNTGILREIDLQSDVVEKNPFLPEPDIVSVNLSYSKMGSCVAETQAYTIRILMLLGGLNI